MLSISDASAVLHRWLPARGQGFGFALDEGESIDELEGGIRLALRLSVFEDDDSTIRDIKIRQRARAGLPRRLGTFPRVDEAGTRRACDLDAL